MHDVLVEVLAVPADGSSGAMMAAALGAFLAALGVFVVGFLLIDRRRRARRASSPQSVHPAELDQPDADGDEDDTGTHHE